MKTGLTRGVKNVIGLKRPAPYEVDLQTTDWFINLVEKFNSGKLALISDLAERQAALNQLVIEGHLYLLNFVTQDYF
jgi:branched-chain amino acid transport system permease protein